MAHEQFEIWVDNKGKWELIALFRSLKVASAVFATRSYRQKLLHVTYNDEGKKVAEDTVAEIGRTREKEVEEIPIVAPPAKKRKAS